MNRGTTIHAATAMDALHASGFLNSVIRGSICDPSLGGPEDHVNARFFGEVEWYLTCRQVAHAADIFNTYCQNILAEVLEVDASVWPQIKKHLSPKRIDEAIAKLKVQRQTDSFVREAFRESLDVMWCGEVEIIAELRNRIVHQSGYDPEGKIGETIQKFPPAQQFLPPAWLDPADFPVAVDASGKLRIDARTGYWATSHVQHHIHMMDQTLCHRFGITRNRRPQRKIGFSTREESSAFMLPPGTPLPVPNLVTTPSVPAPELPPPYIYIDMANQDEIDCAKCWRLTREELDSFIREYCEEVGVDICGLDGSLAGRVRSHTIEGHDHHLGYQLCPKDDPRAAPKHLGVRLRQQGFQPFITIWGTNAQMQDFRPCAVTNEVRECIRDCVDDTLSR
jgi:hypothetical protein